MANMLYSTSDGVIVHDIVYQINDKVKWSKHGSKVNTSIIRYDCQHEDYPNEAVAYFQVYGQRVYFHELLPCRF